MELAESSEVKEILEKYREIWALKHALSLMVWDMWTYIPEGASGREVRLELPSGR